MKEIEDQYIDSLDKCILTELEKDGRMSFSSLGEKIGLSKTPCWNRVQALQSQGVIEGYQARLNPVAMGLHIRALVHVVVNFEQYQAFEQAIQAHPAIRACHAVTGDFDYVLEILATNINAFDLLLRAELSGLPGVERFNTAISTRMVKAQASYTDML